VSHKTVPYLVGVRACIQDPANKLRGGGGLVAEIIEREKRIAQVRV
jgi:hypothetical protein